jgi:hypothetical protein
MNPMRQKAVEFLQRLTLAELYGQVVKPWFTQGTFDIAQEQLDQDLLVTTFEHGQWFAKRIRIVPFTESGSRFAEELLRDAESALRRRYLDDQVPLVKYYLLWPMVLPVERKEEIKKWFDNHAELSGRSEILDLESLYKKVVESDTLGKIVPLQIINARHEAQERARNGEGVFALHWSYRAFRLYLQQEPPDLEKALSCIDAGLTALEADVLRTTYYFRLLRRVFSTWRGLLGQHRDLFGRSRESLAHLLDELAETDFRGERWLVWLLQDFEHMFIQLEIMAERFVNTPAGLSTLQICRLLLRCGFPPSEPEIAARLERIHDELDREKRRLDLAEVRSIDGSCSMCTGAVVSCLSLARQHDKATSSVQWLSNLGDFRYCHMERITDDVSEGKHALHYAASVLEGLMDFAEGGTTRDEDLIGLVLEKFFPPGMENHRAHRGFYLEWVKHANIDLFENYRYILSAFLRYRLSGRGLPSRWNDLLAEAVRVLVRELKKEYEGIQETHLVYSARTNLPSLTLGLLLGVEEARELAQNVTGYLRRRRTGTIRGAGSDLWDSNIDRNAIMVESYLSYWEAILYLDETGVFKEDPQLRAGFLPLESIPRSPGSDL